MICLMITMKMTSREDIKVIWQGHTILFAKNWKKMEKNGSKNARAVIGIKVAESVRVAASI